MNTEEIKKQVHTFLNDEFPNDAVELTYETDLLNEWFVDSLGIINMIMFLESQFDINVARPEINGDNFKNIATLADYIASKSK